ncbi:MAG TPA: hypothetical protein VFJ60_05045 [Gaiella sp.]|nr:hypothetical protein [Gaiella sp.]
MTHTPISSLRSLVVAGGAAAVIAAVLLPAAAATPTPVTPPQMPGAAPLFGPLADAGVAQDAVAALKTVPDVALPGKAVTISGAGLPKGKDLKLVWMTANVRWVIDPKADSVDYVGRKVDKIGVALANTQTDATGAFKVSFRAPRDFGGLHDIFAVVDGKQVAKGGFLLERSVRISPVRGPVGTPITVTVVGMGSPTYESVGAVLYDNKFTGAISANTTRGVSVFKLRASGGVGTHWIEVAGSSHTVPYLNMEQSPVPWTDGHRLKFQVTADRGAPKPSVDQPKAVTASVAERTTLQNANLVAGSMATAQLSSTSGPVLSKTTISGAGLVAGQPYVVQWASVVGNRVNCTGQCWNFVNQVVASGVAGADGTVKADIKVPDGLGGWHAVQIVQSGQVRVQTSYFVKRTFVSIPKTVKAGQPFVVELKGVGWTQLDNTVAVTYDNAYIGYACGFNSNGYVRIQLFATGDKGTHLIDLYPLLYTQQPAYPYPQLGMVPLLGYAMDAPGLGAGYDLPAFRLAIQVV